MRRSASLAILLLPCWACAPQDSGPAEQPPRDETPAVAGAPETLRFIQEVSWSPDGSRLVFSQLDVEAMEYRIHEVRSDGSGVTPLTEGPWDLWTSWSPDGSRIAFGSKRDDNADVWVMRADGSDVTRLTDHPAHDGEPAWAPDGSTIAFTSERDGERRIFLMNADGSDQRRIGQGPGREYAPRWSPDGSRLAFYATEAPGDDRIHVMERGGSGRTELARGVWPSWWPDGSGILYTRQKEGGLVTMRPDGTQASVLLEGHVVLGESSPDGSKIAFIKVTWSSPEGWPSTSEIFLANADGSGVMKLTGNR